MMNIKEKSESVSIKFTGGEGCAEITDRFACSGYAE